MKLLPISLPPSGASATERHPLSLPFGVSDLMWRYPVLNFNVQGQGQGQGPHTPQPAAAPMFDFKNHLPAALGEYSTRAQTQTQSRPFTSILPCSAAIPLAFVCFCAFYS